MACDGKINFIPGLLVGKLSEFRSFFEKSLCFPPMTHLQILNNIFLSDL